MDITENKKALKIILYAAAAVWLPTVLLTASPLTIPHLGWLLIGCHLAAAFSAYCLKDMDGKDATGWIFAVLFCPAVAPILLKEDVDGYMHLGAAAAVFLLIGSWILLKFSSLGAAWNLVLAVALFTLYISCIVFAARIADDHFRNAWLWGIGCALFPPLLLVLVIKETDFEDVPGGKAFLLAGGAAAFIFHPAVWLLLKLWDLLYPVREKIAGFFQGSSSGSSGYSGGYTSSVSKSCGRCGKPVSASSIAGGRCPHCGAYWSFERTTRR